MKTAAILAVFVLSSFAGIKPADAATTSCRVHIPYFKIRVRQHNVSCYVTGKIVKASVKHGDTTDGRYGFRYLNHRWACYNIGDVGNYIGQRTSCRSGWIVIVYRIWLV